MKDKDEILEQSMEIEHDIEKITEERNSWRAEAEKNLKEVENSKQKYKALDMVRF